MHGDKGGSELLRRAVLSCRVCSQEPECLSWNLGAEELKQLDDIVDQPPPLPDGHRLFRAGDTLKALYAVRRGVFKTYRDDGDGREQVVGFSLAGEIVGLDGVFSHRHRYDAVAVSESDVCLFPYAELTRLMAGAQKLREQILRLASRDAADRAWRGDGEPEQRVARFLMDMAERTRASGGTDAAFALPMPLTDIASYLHLAVEDVERGLYQLSAGKLIALEGRGVRMLDPEKLSRLARYERSQG